MQIEIRYRNIEARRFSYANVPININNNSTVVSVSEEEENLRVGFVFTANYEPNIGMIRIEGDIVVKDSKDNIKKAIDEWKKSNNKNLPENLAENIHNSILSNCIIEATILSRDINLPAPIPTPQISINKQSKSSPGEAGNYIR